MRTATACFLLATFALAAVGCRGCLGPINVAEWQAAARKAQREFGGQAYLLVLGPQVIASAIGSAAPPQAMGGLSVLSTEIAERQWFEQVLNSEYDAQCAASVVGTAGIPGGCGGLSTIAVVTAREDWGERLGEAWHVPSLFAVPGPNKARDIARPVEAAGVPMQ